MAVQPGFALLPGAAQLLVIDMQERFQAAIPGIAADAPCGRALRILAQGCRLLGVPALLSEQYPQGLGPTLGWLRAELPEAEVLSKTAFSCVDDDALRQRLDAAGRREVLVAGIEAHVCVLGTVADLLTAGYAVTVAADAVDSRAEANRELALATMRQLGALVLPVESILFRLQRRAGVGAFKELSKLVR